LGKKGELTPFDRIQEPLMYMRLGGDVRQRHVALDPAGAQSFSELFKTLGRHQVSICHRGSNCQIYESKQEIE